MQANLLIRESFECNAERGVFRNEVRCDSPGPQRDAPVLREGKRGSSQLPPRRRYARDVASQRFCQGALLFGAPIAYRLHPDGLRWATA